MGPWWNSDRSCRKQKDESLQKHPPQQKKQNENQTNKTKKIKNKKTTPKKNLKKLNLFNAFIQLSAELGNVPKRCYLHAGGLYLFGRSMGGIVACHLAALTAKLFQAACGERVESGGEGLMGCGWWLWV